jgi:hypothetical protein
METVEATNLEDLDVEKIENENSGRKNNRIRTFTKLLLIFLFFN